jgi:Ran-binding protein 1
MSALSELAVKETDPENVGGEGGEDDNGPAPDEESTATFTPVVQLTAVEVKTMEEEEDVLYKQRGKLFVFGETLLDKGTGNKVWKERGVGEVKLLKHRENNRIRVLMRQEKTMKLLINHFLDPRIVLTPNVGSDKSWVWVAFDFSEGSLIETTFALRFSSAEIAQEFKKEFEKGQSEMSRLMAGLDETEGKEEVDEATKAIESLAIKKEGDTNPEEGK